MTIRIIRAGKLPEDKLYNKTCTKCSTVFEYTVKDTRYGGQRDDCQYIECPLCRQTLYHTEK